MFLLQIGLSLRQTGTEMNVIVIVTSASFRLTTDILLIDYHTFMFVIYFHQKVSYLVWFSLVPRLPIPSMFLLIQSGW